MHGEKEIMRMYFLQGYLLMISVFVAVSLEASTIELSYQKFIRLNKPLNKSDSGDVIGLSFESSQTKGHLDTYLNADSKFYFQDNSALNYSLQEGYLLYKNSNYELTVGRKILDWNENEKYWSLGFLNGLQSFSLLSTEEEGVTGLLYHQHFENFEIELLGSYLFIPQLNPSIDFEGGQIKSRSEWMRLPPRRTVVSGLEVGINYNVANYQVEKIIFNKSLGGNLLYKWKKGGFSAFAIYKPENRLRVNASAYYDNLGTGKVIVTADPTVNHHAYYGFQVFQNFYDVLLRGGFSYVDPNAKLGKDFLIDISNARKTFKSEYFNINPRYDKEVYSHMSANYIPNSQFQFSLNYIQLISDNVRGNDDFFSDTVKWKQTIGIGAKFLFWESFSTAFDLKYDFVRKDNIMKGEAKYNYKNEVSITLGYEILKAPDNSSYWSYYRTADTFFGQIGFIF